MMNNFWLWIVRWESLRVGGFEGLRVGEFESPSVCRVNELGIGLSVASCWLKITLLVYNDALFYICCLCLLFEI